MLMQSLKYYLIGAELQTETKFYAVQFPMWFIFYAASLMTTFTKTSTKPAENIQNLSFLLLIRWYKK